MSKQIFDSVELLKDGSPLVTISEATKLFPTKCSRATVERFIRRGAGGVKLATVKIGGRRFTSENAVWTFLENIQNTAPEPARTETKRGNLSKGKIAELSRKYGLPEPHNTSQDKAQ